MSLFEAKSPKLEFSLFSLVPLVHEGNRKLTEMYTYTTLDNTPLVLATIPKNITAAGWLVVVTDHHGL